MHLCKPRHGQVLLALNGSGTMRRYQLRGFAAPQLCARASRPPASRSLSLPRQVTRVTIYGGAGWYFFVNVPKFAVVSALDSVWCDDIGGINFMVSQASKLLDEAREKAIARAPRPQSGVLRQGGGVTARCRRSLFRGQSVYPRRATWLVVLHMVPRSPRRLSRRVKSTFK